MVFFIELTVVHLAGAACLRLLGTIRDCLAAGVVDQAVMNRGEPVSRGTLWAMSGPRVRPWPSPGSGGGDRGCSPSLPRRNPRSRDWLKRGPWAIPGNPVRVRFPCLGVVRNSHHSSPFHHSVGCWCPSPVSTLRTFRQWTVNGSVNSFFRRDNAGLPDSKGCRPELARAAQRVISARAGIASQPFRGLLQNPLSPRGEVPWRYASAIGSGTGTTRWAAAHTAGTR